jgi:hypothetical protein
MQGTTQENRAKSGNFLPIHLVQPIVDVGFGLRYIRITRSEGKIVASTTEKPKTASEALLSKLDKMVDEMSADEISAAHKRLQTALREARASRAQSRETA